MSALGCVSSVGWYGRAAECSHNVATLCQLTRKTFHFLIVFFHFVPNQELWV